MDTKPGLVVDPPELDQTLAFMTDARVPMSTEMTATEYVVGEFIAENSQAMISGSPGVGKTNAVGPLCIAATWAMELPTLDFPEPRHVIYLTEDARQINEILQGAIKHLGADEAILQERFHLFNLSSFPSADFSSVGQYAESLPAPDGSKAPPLIVVDTLSAAGAIKSENDNGEIATLLARMNSQFKGFPQWLIHHLAKADWGKTTGDSTARGGGAFEANVQAIFSVYIDDFGNRIMMASPRKRRDQGDTDQLIIESEIHTAKVVTRSGREQLKKYIVARPRRYDADERERAVEIAKSIADSPAKDRISGWVYSQHKNGRSTAHNPCWEWCKAEGLGITQTRARELLDEVKAEARV